MDTNVLVSAVLGNGNSRQLLQRVLTRGELWLSEEILDELGEVLRTDARLAEKISATLRARYIALLARAAHLVRPARVQVAEDPGDAAIVGTAIAARGVLVTGDKALLGAWRVGSRVLSVAAALDEVDMEGTPPDDR